MYKCQLQELCQKQSWDMPEYTTVREGLDHAPRFTATVTVNNLRFETPVQCRNSKEAQNLAAQLAFNHFNSPQALPAPLSGSSCSSTHAGLTPTDKGVLHPQQENIGKSSGFREIPFGCEDAKRPKDLLHMYKNRLQQYAQKHSLNLPAYCYEFDGPPHARRFKAKVTFGDKTYGTLEFFPTLKEAEHAAAKIAFESLSHDVTEEDEVLFKTLLQQLAQKEGFLFPSYITNKSGPPHSPTFMSTVEVGGNIFQGEEGKTKKQAEMRAAKIAYNALIERRAAQFPPSGYHTEGASEVTSPNMQSIIYNGLQQEFGNGHPGNREEAAHNKDFNSKEAMKISSSSERFVVPTDLQENIQPKFVLIANKELNTEVQDANRCRCSSSSEVNGHLQDPLPDENDTALISLQLKTPNDNDNDLLVASDNPKPAGVGHVSSRKTVIYPRSSNMAIPAGASMLPCSDDKWIAFTVEMTNGLPTQWR